MAHRSARASKSIARVLPPRRLNLSQKPAGIQGEFQAQEADDVPLRVADEGDEDGADDAAAGRLLGGYGFGAIGERSRAYVCAISRI